MRRGQLRRLLGVLAACAVLNGCAIGVVNERGDLYGIAVGHAKLQHCTAGKGDCDVIEGGALSNNFAEFLSHLLTVVGAYFGLGL